MVTPRGLKGSNLRSSAFARYGLLGLRLVGLGPELKCGPLKRKARYQAGSKPELTTYSSSPEPAGTHGAALGVWVI